MKELVLIDLFLFSGGVLALVVGSVWAVDKGLDWGWDGSKRLWNTFNGEVTATTSS